MFTRLYLYLAIAALAAFIPVILLIASQPTNSDLITALLPEEGCPTPCLMGIRPGETTALDTMAQLEAHPWVRHSPIFVRPINDINTFFLYWDWSGEQPGAIDSSWQGEVRVHYNVAAGVIVRTPLSLGNVWSALGPTPYGAAIPATIRPDRNITLILAYPERGILLRTTIPRRASAFTYWSALVEWESANREALAYFSQYSLPRPCRWSCPRG